MSLESDGPRPTATAAFAVAQSASAEIKNHEEICTIRYTQIQVDIKGIRDLLKWIGTSCAAALGALAIFGVEQWVQANRADHNLEATQREAQRAQIQFLQTQIQTLVSQMKPSSPVVVNNPPVANPSPMVPAEPAAQ